MKALLTSPINPISNSAYSHRSAQAEIYAQQLYNYNLETGTPVDIKINYGNKEKDYDQYDVIYVYHGSDWGGTLNLFGGPAGLSDKEGLVKLLKSANKILSLGIEMPDYAGLLRKRLKPGQTFGSILDELPAYQPTKVALSPSYEGTSKLVVGDSHAICMYRPGFEILSIPFKTCHGALSTGLATLMRDKYMQPEIFNEIEFYFGNIDIRHHLCRQENPKAAAIKLAERYYEQVSGFNAKTSIYEPLPIEDISRKLPKTGMYKGTPFYGSWEERNEVRNVFADSLEQLCNNGPVTFKRWTDPLKNAKGELNFSAMERPRSVHLARASYPYWKGFVNAPSETPSLEGFFN